eukprot:1148702-Pelagomonas_calceolata.AAC.6
MDHPLRSRRGSMGFVGMPLACLCRDRASSSATVMLRSPGQARGGRQQGGGPRIEFLWPEWKKRCPVSVGVIGRLFP